jgi:predicted O-methyltransferase YrrM
LSRQSDALVPRATPVVGDALHDAALAAALHDVELGTWTLGPRSIEVLGALLRTTRPKVIFEFGSGVSTVCLAHFGAAVQPPPRIISLEQDAAEVERTRSLVARLPAAASVTVLHSPLVERIVEGRRLSSYSISEAELDRVLDGQSIDLVLIDGPAAEDGARFGTLPLVHALMSPGAPVVMDDALRDGELAAARQWRELHLLSIRGVLPIEHGLMMGSVPSTSSRR